MKIKRSTIFNSLTVLSLLLAAAIAIAWLKSFDAPSQLFSFSKDEENFALYSKGGQFLLVGPPTEPLKDPLPRDLVFQMSNADFDWSPIGSDYVCGAARRDTPTWQVYQHFLQRDRRGMGLEPNMRIFIAQAKDDPSRFVPAHMLLMFAAEPKRVRPRISPQKWLETGFRRDADGAQIPEVIMRADQTQKAPDFSTRWDLKQEWSDVMEIPRSAIFHGWIWLAAMLPPFAWLTRPRWRKPTFIRWIINSLALASFIICLTAISLWIRSRFVEEQFLFARKPQPPVSGWRQDIDSFHSISSSKGRLTLIKNDTIRNRPFYDPWGYQRRATPWPTRMQATTIIGEKSAKFFGIEFYEVPSQVLNIPMRPTMPPGRAAPIPPPSPMTPLEYGVQAFAISYWLIVLVTALAPALWICNLLLWRNQIQKEDRPLAKRCLSCGYDMRATPGQCPECGELSSAVLHNK
jgi:hypothetical protein